MATKSATLRMPQRRLYTHSNKRKKVAGSILSIPASFSIRAAAALLVLFLFLGLSFVTSYKIHIVAQDIQMLEEHYSAIQKENKMLSDKYAHIASQHQLAMIGKRLGLHKPTKDQIITLR